MVVRDAEVLCGRQIWLMMRRFFHTKPLHNDIIGQAVMITRIDGFRLCDQSVFVLYRLRRKQTDIALIQRQQPCQAFDALRAEDGIIQRWVTKLHIEATDFCDNEGRIVQIDGIADLVREHPFGGFGRILSLVRGRLLLAFLFCLNPLRKLRHLLNERIAIERIFIYNLAAYDARPHQPLTHILGVDGVFGILQILGIFIVPPIFRLISQLLRFLPLSNLFRFLRCEKAVLPDQRRDARSYLRP